MTAEGGAPLDVEADDGAVEVAELGSLGVDYPFCDRVGIVRHGGVDGVVEKGNIVRSVSVVRVAMLDGNRH